MKHGSIKISRFSEGLTVFKPDYYLNKGKKIISDLIDNGFEKTNLDQISDKLYQGGIFKRVFVENKEKAFLYITATDMVKNEPLSNAKYISKKYTPWINEMTLKNNQILVSCAGTVGNTALVNKSYSGCIGSQEIIRIETSKIPYGYLYAYLSSPLVNQYIQSMVYGAVIPRISPTELGRLPVLLTSVKSQNIIHELIVESSKLRVESSKLLLEAQKYFEDLAIEYKYGSKTNQSISISQILQNYKRFDASYSIVSEKVENTLKNSQIPFVTINSQSSGIFIGPRAKRTYVENGIPFLTTSGMQKQNPTKTDRYISAKSSKGFIVSEGWLLTTRSGTLGDTIFTLPCIDGFAVTEDAIRIVVSEKSELSNYYLYAFLKSNIGKNSLLSGSYGSVIQHLNEEYVGNIKVPILNKTVIKEIDNKVEKHVELLNKAILKESEAIDLIEKEIESWQ
jgi:type I restriction enzyme S subunit